MTDPRPLEVIEIAPGTLPPLANRIRKQEVLSSEESNLAADALESHDFVLRALTRKETTIRELRRLLGGFKSERKKKLYPQEHPALQQPTEVAAAQSSSPAAAAASASPSDAITGAELAGASHDVIVKKKRKGHGRIAAAAYTGADTTKIHHDQLQAGVSVCPKCEEGKVYGNTPRRLVKLRGQAPIGATSYEIEKLRCHACGARFEAQVPEEARGDRFDPSATAMIINLRYGNGVPFNRLKNFQEAIGIPMPVGTQWRKVEGAANALAPLYEELRHRAAECPLMHNDDTSMTVLSLLPNAPISDPPKNAAEQDAERTGIFTSGIVCVGEEYRIALFMTGRQHAGENLNDVLSLRPPDLAPPIQMCDALSRNTSPEFKTILVNCLTHGRRRFVNVRDLFPDPVLYVIEVLGNVYENDALTRDMDPLERLRFHQEKSGPLMSELHSWMREQFDSRKVEPNSQLGDAFRYMLKHWEKLTRFLIVPGAPLDNNICERALKKAILHRKNSLFYRTMNGARVGDLFMSLIQTAALNGVDPFGYITQLLRNVVDARASPGSWMPWNYRRTLAARGTQATPAAS